MPWWRRSVPLWVPAVLLVAAVAAVAALAGQLVSRSDEITNLEGDLAGERSTSAEAREEADGLRDELASTLDDLDDETERADRAEEEALTAAEAALADRVAEVAARAAELDGREADLTAREQQLDTALNGMRASQFGDGVHQVGRDIQPGRYHTDGSGRTCYYALLGPDGRDILDNNNVDGPVTIIIDSAFFESSRCGTWTKIG